MQKRKTALRIAAIAAVVALFASYNAGLYVLVTRRCGNNYSAGSNPKMVDVGKYLPFEDGSELARVETDVKLGGDLPVLDGAAALVPVYASFINAVYPEGCVTYDGGVFSDDNHYGENFAADSAMQYKNTVRGYKAVVDGDTDVFFCTKPSAEQQKYADEQGVDLEFIPIGLEAFVFFVNAENPIDDLSCEQIRGIYSGEYSKWSEVGGADRYINPITRLAGSGSQTAMEAFMKDKTIADKRLTSYLGAAIGYSFRYYMTGMVSNSGVKMISLNGVYPSEENIRSGQYPVITTFYAIYRKDNGNENVKTLIDFILSPEGQRLINESGYVGING